MKTTRKPAEYRWDIRDNVYKRLFRLHVCSRERFDQQMRRYVPNFVETHQTANGRVAHLANRETGDVFTAIWFPPAIVRDVLDGDPYAIGVVTHEAMHALLYEFDHIGIRPSCEEQEPTCYYAAFIVEEIVTRLRIIGRRTSARRKS